eukprot:COSAG02_NODE_15375_length_1176_cov_1.565460_1_plen_38_part_10
MKIGLRVHKQKIKRSDNEATPLGAVHHNPARTSIQDLT